MVVPDFKKEGWFWDTYWAADVTPVEGMAATYDKKARSTTWRGSYAKFPSEIFSLMYTRGEKR